MAKENRIKRLIQEGGFTIEEFIKKVATKEYIDSKLLRHYIETDDPPHLQHKDLRYSFAMARELGLTFPQFFLN